MHFIVPLCFLIAVLSGRYLQLGNPVFISVLLTVITAAAFVVMLIFRPEYGWINSTVLSLALLFSTVTQFYFILHAVRIYEGYDTTVPAIIFAVNTVVMIVMFIKAIDDSWYKAAFGVITVLFAMGAVAYSGYLLVSGSIFGEKQYASGPDSLDGGYRTYVTYRESGLTSDGGTYVYTVRTEECGVPFGKLKYAPRRIYSGGKLAYENMLITWIDNETLLIDGEVYSASKSPEENDVKENSESVSELPHEVSEPVSEPEISNGSSAADISGVSGTESGAGSALPED